MQKTSASFKKCFSACCCCAEPEPDTFEECYTRTGDHQCPNQVKVTIIPIEAPTPDQVDSAPEASPEPIVMVEDPNHENEPELAVLPPSMVDEEERRAASVAK